MWHSDPLMVAGGALVGIDPITGDSATLPRIDDAGRSRFTPTAPPPPVTNQAMLDALRAQARTGISDAFTAYGVDPNNYAADIDSRLASIIAGIPAGTTDPSSYFSPHVGTKLISDLETGYRNKLYSDFDTGVTNDFIPLTADDAFIDQLLGTQRTSADEFVSNMLKRGMINDVGAGAAKSELDRQAGLGRTRLTEIGTGLINTQEGALDSDRAARRAQIGQLKLGAPFDVGAQSAELGKLATDFIGTLGGGLASGLGGSSLFDTSVLGAIAGKAQGAGNIKIGTGSSGGASPQDEEDDEVLKTGNEILF